MKASEKRVIRGRILVEIAVEILREGHRSLNSPRAQGLKLSPKDKDAKSSKGR